MVSISEKQWNWIFEISFSDHLDDMPHEEQKAVFQGVLDHLGQDFVSEIVKILMGIKFGRTQDNPDLWNIDTLALFFIYMNKAIKK